MKDDTINIGQSQTNPDPINITPATPQVDPVTAQLRAQKAQFGLASYMPDVSQDDWYKNILSGKEDEMRQSAASAVNYAKVKEKVDELNNTGTITPFSFTKPEEVIEQGYANQFVKPMTNMTNPFYANSLYGDANKTVPQLVNAVSTVASDVGTKLQQIASGTAPVQESPEALAIQDITRHFNAPTAFPGAPVAILGDVAALLNSPITHIGAKLEEWFPSLKTAQNQGQLIGLQSASDIINDVLGIGATDPKAFERMLGIFNIGPEDFVDNIPGNPRVVNPSGGGVSNLPTVIQNTVKAGTDAVRAMTLADGTRPIETVASAAHGDLKEAAVQQTIADVAAPKTPKEEARQDIQSLTSNFRLDMNNIQQGVGIYGQDMVNRIKEANDHLVENISNKITTVMKVNRTPQAIAQEDVVHAEADRIRDQYRGLGNAILDISPPEYDPLSNTYSTTTKVGLFDGTLFPNENQARLFADLHGIHIKTPTIANNPIGRMNSGPFDYDNYTQFRKSARTAGLSKQDLDKAGLGDSISWSNAKNRQGQHDTGASIENQGSGYYIRVTKPFKEDTKSLLGDDKTGLASTSDTRTPWGWLDTKTGNYMSSPPMTMAKTEMANRRIAAHTASVTKELSIPDWRIITGVSADYKTQFNQLLDFSKELYDKDGNKGYFFQSPAELEDWWMMMYPNEPTPPGEIEEAYFAYVRQHNLDLAMRNIAMYQYEARLGTELHQYNIKDKQGNTVSSDWVHGIKRTKLPSGNDTVMIMGKGHTLGQEQLVPASKLGTTKQGKQIAQDVYEGKAHLVEMYDPYRDEQLGDISKRSIGAGVRYVVSYKAPDTRPLDIGNMVPRRGGGHAEYNYRGAVVQPIIHWNPITKIHEYKGDRIVTIHDHPGEGEQFAKEMNIVRQYREAAMYDEAKWAAKNRLQMGDRYNDWFESQRTPDGKIVQPYLSDKWPLIYLPKGETYADHNSDFFKQFGKGFKDTTTGGSAAAQFKVEYTQRRDGAQLFQPRNKGTYSNPLWEYEPAKMMNPQPILARALNRIANSMNGNSMKIASVTHWLKEAMPHIDMGHNTEGKVWAAPWRVFNSNEIRWKNNSKNLGIVNRLEANRAKIKQFSGAFNPNERFMYSVASKIAQSLYESSGKVWSPLANKMSIAPMWLLPKLTDPWRIARTIAVHPILGMFKPSAFTMQMSTLSNVIAIANVQHAMPGFMAALTHEFTRYNNSEPWLQWIDKTMSETFDHRPGEWREAYEQLNNSGFFNVGSEHSYEDNPDKTMAANAWARAFEWGMTPFREGAQFVRAMSFYTAAHEYNHGGGGKMFENMGHNGGPPLDEGREKWEMILNRAGVLDHNMSRAATPRYQAGPGSIPLMFWSYKLRLTELMLSKQLQAAEKIRLFAISSLIFGLTSGGLGLFTMPVGDYIRSSAQSGDWNVPFTYHTMFNTTPYAVDMPHAVPLSIALEGLPATTLAWLTGALGDDKSIWQEVSGMVKHPEETIAKGNHYDIGPYLGNESLIDNMVTDKPLLDIITGAPGSQFAIAYKNLSPLANDLYDLMTKGETGTTFNDILEAARTINAINAGYSTYTAIQTHNWMSRSGGVMQTDVSPANAIFMGFTGLRDQTAIDAYKLADYEKGLKKYESGVKQAAVSSARKEFNFWLDALNNNDPDAAEMHRIKGESFLALTGYTEKTKNKIRQQVLDDRVNPYTRQIMNKFKMDKGLIQDPTKPLKGDPTSNPVPESKLQPDGNQLPEIVIEAPKPRSHHKQK